MPSQKSPKRTKAVEKMTTDEAIRFLFPAPVIDEAKRRVDDAPRKKGDPPKKSMSEQ